MKKLLIILLLSIIAINIFSSGTNNPRDEIYNHIDRWRNQELIDRLPPIRPYSAQYIISILEKIVQIGDDSDITIAKKYLEYYNSYSLDFILKHNSYYDFDGYNTISGLGAEANLPLHKYVYGSFDINAYLLNQKDGVSASPNTRSPGVDYVIDNMHVDALGTRWYMYQGLNVNASFGTDKVWFQSGLMPSSFGPLFSDSVVLNPNTKQATHYSVTWIHDYFTFSNLFLPIVATDNSGSLDSIADDKYLHTRSLDFAFTNFWDFQFYESVVYGGEGVKPIFFLPFSQYFYSAGQGGTWDVSSLIGLSSRLQFPNNLSFKATAYVDDINAIEFVKLNFDSKLKMAAQGEIEWTPKKSVIDYAKVSYTAIMPYMYTHITETPEDSNTFSEDDTWDIRHHALKEYMNYENYTHYGKSMGPYGMEPNSDKIALNLGIKLPKGFKLKVNGEFQRHGDSSENELDDEGDLDKVDGAEPLPTDGSIFDPGYGWEKGYLYQNSNPFLTQSLLETSVLAEAIITTPKLPLLGGLFYSEFGYAYMYIENYNLEKDKDVSDSFIRLTVNYNL